MNTTLPVIYVPAVIYCMIAALDEHEAVTRALLGTPCFTGQARASHSYFPQQVANLAPRAQPRPVYHGFHVAHQAYTSIRGHSKP